VSVRGGLGGGGGQVLEVDGGWGKLGWMRGGGRWTGRRRRGIWKVLVSGWMRSGECLVERGRCGCVSWWGPLGWGGDGGGRSSLGVTTNGGTSDNLVQMKGADPLEN